MDLSEYKKHKSWKFLKDLYITNENIQDWENFTGINKKYRTVFEIEGNKFNQWIFKNFVWFVEFVLIEFLSVSENMRIESNCCHAEIDKNGNQVYCKSCGCLCVATTTSEILDDLPTINAQLRNSPAILSRLNQMHCEIDASYRQIAGVIWKACPDHYTIDDKKHEQMFFCSYIRMVRKKIEKAIEDTIEKINVLKKAQDKALVDHQAQGSAANRSQITKDDKR